MPSERKRSLASAGGPRLLVENPDEGTPAFAGSIEDTRQRFFGQRTAAGPGLAEATLQFGQGLHLHSGAGTFGLT